MMVQQPQMMQTGQINQMGMTPQMTNPQMVQYHNPAAQQV
jgi:hypothetical protein